MLKAGFFCFIFFVQSCSSEPDTHIHVYVPPEQPADMSQSNTGSYDYGYGYPALGPKSYADYSGPVRRKAKKGSMASEQGPGPDTLSCVAKQDDKSDAKLNRIVGGNFSAFAPYQIFLLVLVKKTEINRTATLRQTANCGGTILNKRFILTAKHCVVDEDADYLDSPGQFPAQGMRVVVGESNLCDAIEVEDWRDTAKIYDENYDFVKDVSEVIVYDEDFSTKIGVDLAILKLSEDLKFVKGRIEPAYLPSKNMEVFYKTAKITGFGGTLDNTATDRQDISCTLKEAMMKVLPCEDLNFDTGVEEGFFLCLYNKDESLASLHESDALPDATACKGDSGGPLVVCEGERIVIIGVAQGINDRGTSTSKGRKKCMKSGTVSFYVDIRYYLPWIRSKIGQVVPKTAQWQEWSNWSKCKCEEGRKGKGIKTRTRSCLEPATGSNQGCPGKSTEEKSCDEEKCTDPDQDPAQWQEWGKWSKCENCQAGKPQTGVTARARKCNRDNACGPGCAVEWTNCYDDECTGRAPGILSEAHLDVCRVDSPLPSGVCPDGFATVEGGVWNRRGWSKIRISQQDFKSCAAACEKEEKCCIFEWSETEPILRCQFYDTCLTVPERHKDYVSCRKESRDQ